MQTDENPPITKHRKLGTSRRSLWIIGFCAVPVGIGLVCIQDPDSGTMP